MNKDLKGFIQDRTQFRKDRVAIPQEQLNLPGQAIPVTIRAEAAYMTLEQVLNEISSLTPSEQLKIAQVIWDKLPNDLGTDLSPAQQAELDRRWAEYKKDPSAALTEEEFKERIRIARGK